MMWKRGPGGIARVALIFMAAACSTEADVESSTESLRAKLPTGLFPEVKTLPLTPATRRILEVRRRRIESSQEPSTAGPPEAGSGGPMPRHENGDAPPSTATDAGMITR